MTCPDCDSLLGSRDVQGETGELVAIECCNSCGGVWVDHAKANTISIEGATNLISSLPGENLQSLAGKGRCPRCFSALEPLIHSSIPRDSKVKVCPSCRGNWFPRGELSVFKKAQKARVEYFRAWKIPVTSVFQILLPVLVLVVVGISIPFTVYLAQKNQEERIMASELLENVKVVPSGSGEVIVAFSTPLPLTSEIEYGFRADMVQKVVVSLTPQTFHQIRLSQLDRGNYQYKILLHKDGKTISSPTRNFTVE